MDTFDFTTSAPGWKLGADVEDIELLSYRPMSEEVRYSLRKIPGLGSKVCYEGPGDQEHVLGLRISDVLWDDFFNKYVALMAIKGCTGTALIVGDPAEPHVRESVTIETALMESVAPSEEPVSSPGEFSMRFIVLIKKLRIVG